MVVVVVVTTIAVVMILMTTIVCKNMRVVAMIESNFKNKLTRR